MKTILLTGLAIGGICSFAQAITITLGGPLPLRSASLADATTGFVGSGNATAATLDGGPAAFSSLAPWTEEGQATAGFPTGSGDLVVALTSGSWGGNGPAGGTWSISDANFWTTYGSGAISIHVGNGNGDPDHFVFLLASGATSGTWNYHGDPDLKGGGLSNLKLYGAGTGTNVPDGGATAALLGVALLGMGGVRRMTRSRMG